MRSILDGFINNFIIKRSKQHRVLSALFILALVVTMGVFLRLKLIGISMTYEPSSDNPGGLEAPLTTINNSLNGGDYGDGKGFTVNLYNYQVTDKMGSNFAQNKDIRSDGINENHALHFLPSGGNFGNNNYPTQDNTYMTPDHYTGEGIALQGIVQKNLGADGYPALSAAATQQFTDLPEATRTESLKYLFSAGDPNVTEYQDVIGLFRQAGNWIEFDSSRHYAYFLPAAQSKLGVNQFGVDGTTLFKSNGEAVGFFPFNTKNPDMTDVGANMGYEHHFGLSMTAKFTIYESKQINGQDMEFRFDGDDDLWVFVDGVLVLDIGGIHRPLGGSINFTTGEVKVDKAAQVNCGEGSAKSDDNSPLPDAYVTDQVRYLKDIFGEATYNATFTEGSEHEMKVFYLERGGVNSNLKITTNIFERQHVIVKKDWEDNGHPAEHPEITYELYRMNKETGAETKIDNIAEYMSNPSANPGVLNAEKNWEEVIDKLPVSGENGELFYYMVKESSYVPGYKTEIPPAIHTDMPSMPDENAPKWFPKVYITSYNPAELAAPVVWAGSYNNGQINFTGQYQQVFFTIPQEVKNKTLSGVEVVLANGNVSNLGVKFTKADAAHTQLAVAYGSTALGVENVDPASIDEIGLMYLANDAATYDISEIRFYTGEGVKLSTATYDEAYIYDYDSETGTFTHIHPTNGETTITEDDHLIQYTNRYNEVKLDMREPYIKLGGIQSISATFAADTTDDSVAFKIYSGDEVTQVYGQAPRTTRTWNLNNTQKNLLNARANDPFLQFGLMSMVQRAMETRLTRLTVNYYNMVDNPFPKPHTTTGDGFNIRDYGDTFTITNTRLESATVAVEKNWVDMLGNVVTPDETVTVDLYRYRTLLDSSNHPDGEPVLDTSFATQSITLKASSVEAENYKGEFTDLLTNVIEGGKTYIYSYAVKERGEDDTDHLVHYASGDYKVAYDNDEPVMDGKIVITNTWQDIISNDITISVEKIWKNYSDVVMFAPEVATAVLTRQRQLITLDSDGEPVYGAAEADPTFGSVEILLGTAEADLRKTLPGTYPTAGKNSVDNNLYKYTYYISEKNAANDTYISAAGDVYTVTVDRNDSASASDFTILNKSQTHFEAPGDATVSIRKRIDALEILNTDPDGTTQKNPDTDVLDGANVEDDLYRLYLDIESHSQETPIDLLIVVDQSGSMYGSHDINFDGKTGQYRDVVLSSILNGEARSTDNAKRSASPYFWTFEPSNYHDLESSVTEDSLINMFLSLNPDNQVAVVGFDANRYDRKPTVQSQINDYTKDYPYRAGAPDYYDYTKDSRLIRGWSNAPLTGSGLDVEGMKYTGTNYEAGLLKAADLLRDTAIQNDGHKKVMIFFSDGVPTCYIRDEEPHDRMGSTLSGAGQEDNEEACRQPSIDAFKEFIKEFPQLTVFSVGLSGELSETEAVLSHFVNNGGEYLYAGDNGNLLRKQLLSVLLPNTPLEAVITDELSENVKYYEKDPDILVTMRTRGTNETPVTIWENGAAVPGVGQFAYLDNTPHDIVKNVTYEPGTDPSSTGKITVTFDEMYLMTLNQIYTVSYNVQVTEKAYEYYAAQGSYPDTGDDLTDYANGSFANKTSSGEKGFNSNIVAKATYRFEGKTQQSLTYDHPVVQIATTDITVTKKWVNEEGETVQPVVPVQVQLYRTRTEHVTAPEQPEGGQTGPVFTGEGFADADGVGVWRPVTQLTPGERYVIAHPTQQNSVLGKNQYNNVIDYVTYNQAALSDNVIWVYGTDHSLKNVGRNLYINATVYGQNSGQWALSGSDFTPVEYANGKISTSKNGNTIYPAASGDGYSSATSADASPSFIVYQYTIPEPEEPEEPEEPGDLNTLPDVPVGDPITLEKGKLTKIIPDLPVRGYEEGALYDYSYYIVEIDTENKPYTPEYSSVGDVLENGELIVTNTVTDTFSYELPNTGGPGTYLYYTFGAMLLAVGLTFRYICKRKRERGSVA